MVESYPIQLRLAGRKCVVVGGGRVAARKVARLREAGADVHMVSPSFCGTLANRPDVTRHTVEYRADYLSGAMLVFACTDDENVNREVAHDARRAGAWCNVADDPDACDFHLPARLKRGRLQVSVSTDGASPQLAAAIRRRLESEFGDEYAILTEELARARQIVRQRVADAQVRREVFETLCADCGLELLRRKDREGWRGWFERVLAHRLEGKRR
jgi:precorrin-2 dehydrogenase / sirohydrochlorin ferrochelatase